MSSAGGPLPIKQKIALDEAIKMESNPSPEPRSISDSIGASDNLLYIYTSGTTGLPKAVIIKHIRLCKLIDEADLEHVTLHCLYTRVTLNIKDSGSQTVGKGVPMDLCSALIKQFSEQHFRTCAHGRTYPHVRMWGAVRNFCNFYCAGGVRCGMVKEMPPHPHFNSGKNLGKFLSIFPNFSKKVFPHHTVPHNSLKKFLRTAPHPTSLIFFCTRTAPHIRLPLNSCFVKEF